MGSLSFTYSGDKSGSYSADGDLPVPIPTLTIWDYEWATAKKFTDNGKKWILINANLPTSPGSRVSHIIQMHIPEEGNGSYPLKSDLGNEMLIFDYKNGGGPDQVSYILVSGTVELTVFQADHIAGSFSGTADDGTGSGKTIQLTNGKFDLKFSL